MARRHRADQIQGLLVPGPSSSLLCLCLRSFMVLSKTACLTSVLSVDTDGDREKGRGTGEPVKAEDRPWCIGGS